METVKIIDTNPNNKRGWKIINKDDIKDTDTIFGDEPKAKVKKAK